jgi:hypothetical protein
VEADLPRVRDADARRRVAWILGLDPASAAVVSGC